VTAAARSVSAFRGWEKRRELDERVTVNLEPHLIPLWRKVRAGIVGRPDARAEAFAEYVEEHPREALAALVDACPIAVPIEETETERASALVAAGAIQVCPGVWSLDPRAVVELATWAGDGASVVFTLPPDADAFPPESTEVTVDATMLLDAAEACPPDAWCVDLTADGLAIHAMGGGLRLCGSEGAVKAVAPMPGELPEEAA
jgi:hypothetical protein